MPDTNALMEGSAPPFLASMLGQDLNLTISAAGTTQATATQLKAGLSVVTTVGSSAGVLMPAAQASPICAVVNDGANSLSIYPAVGEKLNNLAVNLPVTVASGKTVFLLPSGQRWAVNLSA